MALVAGTQIGPFRIVAPLGAGGMGEVYRAADPRLGRDVAIKALPPAFARDPERLARFEREARLLASLSHPNVAGIHGLEEHDGRRYLVLELVEGETLAARIAAGALPIDEAVAVCGQIAAGVEAAHEGGIVHRDLKPGNVILTPGGTAKVLDFGLARGDASADSDLSRSPTITAAMTQAGTILGTAAYMSPEQARGKPLDRRTDIWSFGCILYECLTGTRAFEGETVSDVIARILEREPDLATLPASTPQRLRRLIARCLRKDAGLRLRDIGEARIELSEPLTAEADASVAVPAARPGTAWAWSVAALVVGVLGTLGVVGLAGRRAPAPMPRRFTVSAPQLRAEFSNHPRISPDGQKILFASGTQLWLRDLGTFESVPVPGTEGAVTPFWSPDGSQFGYAREGRLWTATLTGLVSTPLCALPENGYSNGATWGRDGEIVFAIFRGGLYTVPAQGGQPRLLLAPDSSEVDFHLPDRLRDHRWVLVAAHAKVGDHPVAIVDTRTRERRNLGAYPGMTSAVYAPGGHLILTFDTGRQQLMVVPFSERRPEIRGEPVLLAAGGLFPSVAEDGTLTYVYGGSRSLRELVWVNRAGHVESRVGQALTGLDLPAISPDGTRALIVAYESDQADLWIQDIARGTRRRLVAGPRDEFGASWVAAGDRVRYCETGNVRPTLMEVPADGSGEPGSLGVEGWWPANTPDGRAVVFNSDVGGQQVLWRFDAGSGGEPRRLTTSPKINEDHPALSPDGRWLACSSDEAGGTQVFVRRLADNGQKQQVSLSHGEFPFWSPDGRTLYYWDHSVLMEVPIAAGETLSPGEPRRVFESNEAGLAHVGGFFGRPALAAARDGRFLAVRRVSGHASNDVLVVQNWQRGLTGR